MVKRHDDQAFGHQRQIECCPTNGIGGEQRAAIAGLKTCMAKIGAHLPNLFQELFAGDADELLSVNFAKDYAAGAALELSENSVEKIRHGTLAPACQIKNNSS